MKGLVVIFGGSGFIGRHLLKRFVNAGYSVRVISRNPYSAKDLKVVGSVGQVEFLSCDVVSCSDEELTRAVSGATIAVNAVDNPSPSKRWDAVRPRVAERVAQVMSRCSVRKFLYLSSAGLSAGDTNHASMRSKILAENAVLTALPTAIILRSGLVFGRESFYVRFIVNTLRLLPFFPLELGEKILMRPLYVGDFSLLALRMLESDMHGIHEVFGKRTYSSRELVTMIANAMNKSPHFVPIHPKILNVIVQLANVRLIAFLLKPWGGSICISMDQLEFLRHSTTPRNIKNDLLDNFGIRCTDISQFVRHGIR